MKCYTHAKEGKDRDAVATCTVCGMGLCMEHVVERDIPLVRGSVEPLSSQQAMQILCERCAERLGLNA